MRTILLSSLVIIFLGGCNITGGMGFEWSCNKWLWKPLHIKDYYLPGRGVWANDTPMSKAKIGAFGGTILGVLMTHSSGDPLLISALQLLVC